MQVKKTKIVRQIIREAEESSYFGISRPESVHELFRHILLNLPEEDKEKEHFWCVGLNQKNRIKYIELVSIGSLNAAVVHPREVLYSAIQKHCAGCICVHNHPSGTTDPSPEDMELTHRLKGAFDTMGIQLFDHVIIGKDCYLSLFERYPELR